MVVSASCLCMPGSRGTLSYAELLPWSRTRNMMTRSGSTRRLMIGMYSGCLVKTGMAVSSTSSTA